jgi:hypothetical protein
VQPLSNHRVLRRPSAARPRCACPCRCHLRDAMDTAADAPVSRLSPLLQQPVSRQPEHMSPTGHRRALAQRRGRCMQLDMAAFSSIYERAKRRRLRRRSLPWRRFKAPPRRTSAAPALQVQGLAAALTPSPRPVSGRAEKAGQSSHLSGPAGPAGLGCRLDPERERQKNDECLAQAHPRRSGPGKPEVFISHSAQPLQRHAPHMQP